MRGRDSGAGEGFLAGCVCAWAPANEMAMTSNNPARDVLFILEFRAVTEPVGEDKCRLDSPMLVAVVNKIIRVSQSQWAYTKHQNGKKIAPETAMSRER